MKQIISTFLLCFLWQFCSAQQVISTAGSYNTNGSISLSSTIGETIITTHENSSIVLTQGFQQPEYVIVNSIVESVDEMFRVNVYPNPSKGNITIDLQSINNEQLTLTVTDLLGQIVHTQNLYVNTANSVDLQREANGQYIFGITDHKGLLLSTHQVQKVQ